MSVARVAFLSMLAVTVAAAETIPGRVAFVGVDHQVYVAKPDGGEPARVTGGEPARMTSVEGLRRVAIQDEGGEGAFRFSYPSWSPDGERLLLLGTRVSASGMPQRAGIYRVGARAGGPVTPLHEDARGGPIYVYWEPRGRRAAVLLSEGTGVRLGLLDTEKGDLHVLRHGFPFYFDWRDDGRRLLVHTGGAASVEHPAEVSLLDLETRDDSGAPAARRVSAWPVAFRAPAWSPDGKQIVYAARADAGKPSELFLAGRDGDSPRRITAASSRLTFSWAADGALALAEVAAPDSPLLAGVNLVSTDDGRREPLWAGPVGAFFWSPDGKRLLIASPDFDNGQWRWIVVDRDERESREVARFLPNPEFQMLLLHFDQYALSHRLWAPDSRHFVFAAYPADAREEEGPVEPVVWIVDAKEAKSRQVAQGRSAFWSPR